MAGRHVAHGFSNIEEGDQVVAVTKSGQRISIIVGEVDHNPDAKGSLKVTYRVSGDTPQSHAFIEVMASGRVRAGYTSSGNTHNVEELGVV